MKISKKILAVILSVVMAFSVSAVAFTSFAAAEEVTPVLFIPGIGQSQTYKYDDEGNELDSWNLLHVNTDFAGYSVSDWVKAVKFVAEFVKSIVVQKDVIKYDTLNDFINVLFADHLRDADGNFINNVVTPNYPCPVSGYDEEAYGIFERRIPCKELVESIGGDNVYVYNYSIFSNSDENADGMNDYIENIIIPQTGASKVILVPMSMGATVVNNYMNRYPDANRIEKVISVVGAWNGSDVFGDLMLADFDDNAPDLVYTDKINTIGLGDDYVGYIINIAARILPKQEVDNILYDFIKSFVNTLVLSNTSLVSLVPHESYDAFAEKYLSTPEMAAVKEQTSKYAEAQANLEARMKYQEETYGTEFYFISGYNMAFGDCDYGFFHFFESYDTTNSDEVIQISSTAPGTSYVPAGTSYSAEYIADPAHHVSPDGSIDTSTCYYEKTSWYFAGQKHELTDNNTALSLAFKIAQNKIKTVDDCPDVYPQFNDSRDIRRLTRDYLPDAKNIDTSAIDAQSAQRLEAAISAAEAMVERTINDREADDAIIAELYNTLVDINAEYNVYPGRYYVSTPSVGTTILTKVLFVASKVLHMIFGNGGFADFKPF